MTMFSNFPIVDYNFGGLNNAALFDNISTQVDLVDRFKDNLNLYTEYFIKDGERPDILSYNFYGTVDYYYLFYLLNEKLRVKGWPLDESEIVAESSVYYPHKAIQTADPISIGFYKGDLVATSDYAAVEYPTFKGKIIEKNLMLGQLIIEPVTEIRDIQITNPGSGYITPPLVTISGGNGSGATAIATINGGSVSAISIQNRGTGYTTVPTITLTAPSSGANTATADAIISSVTINEGDRIYSDPGEDIIENWNQVPVTIPNARVDGLKNQTLGIHHYENAAGERIDLDVLSNGGVNIDQFVGDQTGSGGITYLQQLRRENDSLRQIKVFEPKVARQIHIEYNRLLRS